MFTYSDQLNNTIQLSTTPMRIVSLVPSQTELIVSLGAQVQLVGVTKFCIHPATIKKQCTVIGGTKNININKVHSLNPDLIIANKEENTLAQITALKAHYPVWISDVNTFNDALTMIEGVGNVIGKATEASALIQQITEIKNELSYVQMPRVAYVMWHAPYMVAANGTFIHAMLHEGGFVNVFAHSARYPTITVDDLQRETPEFVFLSSEPFPYTQYHADELQQQLPNSKVVLVDGELFSWYGSRVVQAFHYFKTLRHALNLY
jgi:ABC-type Fe3+-hydroxamate transport system substrate-binding protein